MISDLTSLRLTGEVHCECETPCGTYTMVSNSPQLNRRVLGLHNQQKTNTSSENEDLYPNCDVNVWLRSCGSEVKEPLSGHIKGKIPKWLKGSLIRNGPGSLKVGDSNYEHLFDSSALLHRFGIEDGLVTYQCKFVKSDVYERNLKAKRIVMSEFGTKAVPDPCQSIFQRVAAVFNPVDIDNSMISVYPFGDELYAFSETPIIHKINSQNIQTEGKIDVRDYVTIVHHTSHPHVVDDGTVYNLATSIHPSGPYHNIVMFPSNKQGKSMFESAKIVASVPSRWPLHPSYMHTFGLTENYFVIVQQPLSISLVGAIAVKIKNHPLVDSLRWYSDEMTQISVVNRKTGQLAHNFFTKAFFYLHIINQYEVADHLVLDICSYKDPSMLQCMYIETMKRMQHNPDYAEMFRSRPARYVMPLNPEPHTPPSQNLISIHNTSARASYLEDGRIWLDPERICDLGCETPRIHYEKFLGKPYRYFYAISADVDADNPGTIIKVDLQTKSSRTWCEDNCYPSEPVFVPRPEAMEEDDGIILSAMVWGRSDTNHVGLLVLDAKTFEEIGRAEFTTPGAVPKCLHGWFFPRN